MFVYLIETQVLKEYHKLKSLAGSADNTKVNSVLEKKEEKKSMGIRKSYQFRHGGEMKEESEEKYS